MLEPHWCENRVRPEQGCLKAASKTTGRSGRRLAALPPRALGGHAGLGPFPPVVSRALGLIFDGGLDEGGVEGLARRSRARLQRLFDEHLGASPLAVAKARRVHFARCLLDETDLSVTDVALAAGFHSIRQFNHDFRKTFGRSPKEVRRAPRERS